MVNHKTKIKEEYIKTVSDKYFPQLKPLLKRINEPGVQKKIEELINSSTAKMEDITKTSKSLTQPSAHFL